MEKPAVGTILWHDLTAPNAEFVAKFYESVVGWKPNVREESESKDYEMLRPSDDECVAGVCHAEGGNADLPPVWIVYIAVENVEASIEQAKEMGGTVVMGPKSYGSSSFAVLRDPAGAVFAVMD